MNPEQLEKFLHQNRTARLRSVRRASAEYSPAGWTGNVFRCRAHEPARQHQARDGVKPW